MKTSLTISTLVFSAAFSLSAAAASYEVVEVADGGTLTGKVTFAGDDPAPKVFTISKDTEVCGTGNREIDYVRVTGGALNDTIVYLDKVKSGKEFPAEEAGAALDQKGCAFNPFLQVMHNGGDLEAKNSDPVSHNIHTYEIIGKAKKTVLNISQPKQDSVITKTIKLRRGSHMKIECDQHDFMHGFVFVAKNPYYAMVADDGSYTISDIPPGKYVVKAWHGTLGEKKATVEIGAGAAASADFEYKAK